MVNGLKNSKNRGVSLIEVAIATAILSLVFAGLIGGIRLALEMLDTAKHQTIAAQILQRETERLRQMSWNEINNLQSEQDITGQMDPAFTGSGLSAQFQCIRRAETIRVNYRRVTIEVIWTDALGRPHSRQMETFVGRYGLHEAYRR